MKKLSILFAAILIAAMVLPGCGPWVEPNSRGIAQTAVAEAKTATASPVKAEMFTTAKICWEKYMITLQIEGVDFGEVLCFDDERGYVTEFDMDDGFQILVFVDDDLKTVNDVMDGNELPIPVSCETKNGGYNCDGTFHDFWVMVEPMPDPEELVVSGANELLDIHFEDTDIPEDLQGLPNLEANQVIGFLEGTVSSSIGPNWTLQVYWTSAEKDMMLIWNEDGKPRYWLEARTDSVCYDGILLTAEQTSGTWHVWTEPCAP